MKFVALFVIFFITPFALGADAADVNILNGVGIDQNLDAQIPLDLHFNDSSGRDITLGDCLHNRPVILTLVYFKCPMLCTEVLNNLLRSLNGLSNVSIGRQFDVITVSFDPGETPQLAAMKKASYLKGYGREGAAAGWHFLTGSSASIDALTATAGFRYKWDPQTNQFIHGSGIMILTPQGRISRYFFGIDYPPNDIAQSLKDATQQRVVPAKTDRAILYCFHYDPVTGKYGLIIVRALKLGGGLTVLFLGSFLVVMFYRDAHKQRTRGSLSRYAGRGAG